MKAFILILLSGIIMFTGIYSLCDYIYLEFTNKPVLILFICSLIIFTIIVIQHIIKLRETGKNY